MLERLRFERCANAQGALFGMTDTDLYAINNTTGQARFIGSHGILAGNALVFGPNGTLYAAGGLTNQLFRLDPSTGRASALGDMGFSAGGDLAFAGNTLYLASLSNQLVRVNLTSLPASAAVGRSRRAQPPPQPPGELWSRA